MWRPDNRYGKRTEEERLHGERDELSEGEVDGHFLELLFWERALGKGFCSYDTAAGRPASAATTAAVAGMGRIIGNMMRSKGGLLISVTKVGGGPAKIND